MRRYGMAQYRYPFSDLPNQTLSPSNMAHEINDTEELPTCGGIALYLSADEFAVAFANEISDEAKAVLDDVVATHTGEGPDTIVDLATRQAAEAAAAEAAAAEAEA